MSMPVNAGLAPALTGIGIEWFSPNNFITSASRTGLQILTKNPLPRPESVPRPRLKSCSPARLESYPRSITDRDNLGLRIKAS